MRNVKFIRGIGERNNREKFPMVIFFTLSTLVLAGCNPSRESICGDLPVVSNEINGVRSQIAAFEPTPDSRHSGKAGRRIASVTAPSPDQIRDKREVWMAWGADTLKRTQWAKDALEENRWGRRALPALNDAGLSLVSFHGFLSQDKWGKAVTELDRVESSLKLAHKLACEAQVAPRMRKK